MLYGDEDPTPVAVASNGQSADQVEVVGQAVGRTGSGLDFRRLSGSGGVYSTLAP